MKKSYTCMKKHEVTFKWVIKNFDAYLDTFGSDSEKHSLRSTYFSANINDPDRFHLEINFKQYSISCFLGWKNFTTSVKMKYALYILSEKGEKYRVITESKSLTSGYNSCNSPPYATASTQSTHITCDKTKLLLASKSLFPHNNFTIECYLVVYDNPTSILPAFIRTPYKSINDHFQKFFEDQTYSDVTFAVDTHEFKAHKSVLMARSPVFLAMFEHNMLEKNTNMAKIVDINPKIFELMLKFIYTDKLEGDLSEEDIIALTDAATKYQLDGLQSLCEEKLFNLLTANNVMDILLTAEKFNFQKLTSSIKEFLKAHEDEILDSIDSEYFLMNPHHAQLFLKKKKNLSTASEENLNNDYIY